MLTKALHNSLVELVVIKKIQCKLTNHCSFSQLLQLSQIHKENGMYVRIQVLHITYNYLLQGFNFLGLQ